MKNKVYDVAMEAGHILLQNGAEISIVLGIVVVFEIPYKFFRVGKNK